MSSENKRWDMLLVKLSDEGPNPSRTVQGRPGETEEELIERVRTYFRSNATDEVDFSLMQFRDVGRVIVERREKWVAQSWNECGGDWVKLPAMTGIWETSQCCLICGRCDGCDC